MRSELINLLDVDEFWRRIDGYIYDGHGGMTVIAQKCNSVLRAEAESHNDHYIGDTIHKDFDEFLGRLISLMTTGNKNYRVRMTDDYSKPIKVDASDFIADGGAVMFTITNETEVH